MESYSRTKWSKTRLSQTFFLLCGRNNLLKFQSNALEGYPLKRTDSITDEKSSRKRCFWTKNWSKSSTVLSTNPTADLPKFYILPLFIVILYTIYFYANGLKNMLSLSDSVENWQNSTYECQHCYHCDEAQFKIVFYCFFGWLLLDDEFPITHSRDTTSNKNTSCPAKKSKVTVNTHEKYCHCTATNCKSNAQNKSIFRAGFKL